MVVVLWDKNLSVGVDTLDNQHKTLINILNDLYRAISENKGSAILYLYFCELIEHVKIHFICEETYMTEMGYPGVENHKKEHAAILSKAVQYKEDYDACNTFLSTNHLQFMRAWMLHHMSFSDQKYVPEQDIQSANKKLM